MSTRRGVAAFVLVGTLVAVALATLVSPWASSDPDGLTKVAADHGLDGGEREHPLADGPLSDYSVRGLDEPWGTGLAGLAGVAVTFAAAAGVFSLLRKRRAPPVSPGEDG